MFDYRHTVRAFLAAAGLIAAMASGAGLAGAQTSVKLHAPKSSEIVRNYSNLPMRFEVNLGQTDHRVKFSSRGAGYGLYLTGQEVVLALRRPVDATGSAKAQKIKTDVVRMQLTGGSAKAEPEGVRALPGISNYLLGNDPASWHTGVRSYSRVKYTGVYPGVDLIYYGNQRQLEYDFVVAPGANPKTIQMHFAGARNLKLDQDGTLVIEAENGRIAFHQPVVYQTANGRHVPVDGKFRLLADNSVGFALGSYDSTMALIIDPTLVYSSYLGGSNLDSIAALAVDSTGAVYVTGTTASTDYPVTPGVLQTTFSATFVTKLNASGTALVYSTFLGGSGSQYGLAIAVDSSGNAYVAGQTTSSNFPVTTGAFQTTDKAAAKNGSTGFVSKINPTGTKLVYSTFLGGSTSDSANSLVLDSSGDAYIGGSTYSSDFPTTTGAFQTANNSYNDFGWNEYVAKLNPAGSSLIYATCIGGTGDYGSPSGIHVAVDSLGDAFVTATVLSKDFPVTAGAYQSTNKATGRGNMTLTKVNPAGTRLLYATYLGGTSSPYGDDITNGLAVDSTGDAYLAGTTHETDYPVTTGAYETTNKTGGSGKATGFVTKMNPTGTALVYSTYLGGSAQVTGDYANAVALDSSGDVYITGSTGSTDFPVTSNAYQTSNKAFNYGEVAFLTEMNHLGTGLLYSTYFGGTKSFADAGNAVALGNSGAVYFAGVTGASDFPTTGGAYKTTFNSQNDETGFVAEITLGSAPTTLPTTTTLTSNANPATTGANPTFSASVVPTTGTGSPTGNVAFSIDQKTVATVALNTKGYANYTTTTPLALGQHAILASYSGNSTYSASGGNITENVTSAKPVITPASGVYSSAQLVTIADATAGTTIYYTTDGSTPTSASTTYIGPILVSTSQYISAVAVLSGSPNSPVVSASYQLITAPYALAVAATAISTPKATLNGLVNSYGLAGTYCFIYGTSSAALTSSTVTTALSTSGLGSRFSFAPMYVSATPTNLTTKTTYYYKVVVTTAGGTSSGEALSFTTN